MFDPIKIIINQLPVFVYCDEWEFMFRLFHTGKDVSIGYFFLSDNPPFDWISPVSGNAQGFLCLFEGITDTESLNNALLECEKFLSENKKLISYE